MSRKICGVYGLVDPVTENVRYVGRSTDVLGRFKSHCMCRERSRKSDWILGLASRELVPVLWLIEEVTEPQLARREQYFIDTFVGFGWADLNEKVASLFRDSGTAMHCPAHSDMQKIADTPTCTPRVGASGMCGCKELLVSLPPTSTCVYITRGKVVRELGGMGGQHVINCSLQSFTG